MDPTICTVSMYYGCCKHCCQLHSGLAIDGQDVVYEVTDALVGQISEICEGVVGAGRVAGGAAHKEAYLQVGANGSRARMITMKSIR